MAPKVGEKAVKAPAKKAPAAKKVVKKTTGAGKKKSKSVESYKIYIYKVLKQVDASFDFYLMCLIRIKSEFGICHIVCVWIEFNCMLQCLWWASLWFLKCSALCNLLLAACITERSYLLFEGTATLYVNDCFHCMPAAFKVFISTTYLLSFKIQWTLNL